MSTADVGLEIIRLLRKTVFLGLFNWVVGFYRHHLVKGSSIGKGGPNLMMGQNPHYEVYRVWHHQ